MGVKRICLRYFYDKIRGIKYDLNLEYDFYKEYD